MSAERPAAIVRWWRNVAHSFSRNEAAWLTSIGPWEVAAGFYKGFGLGLIIGEGLELTLGPFALGVWHE